MTGPLRLELLETTLRDGSYAINFQFTAADTAIIGKALEDAGFQFIEIGHGVGLNASRTHHGTAAESDESYLEAAAQALESAKFGMFCIPGVARVADLDMASGFGMGFVRIGTNVTDVEDSAPYIERAKEHGMFVGANFMKSYALEPREFAQRALLSQRYGADVLYIVDSSGGMLTSEVESYMRAVREVSDIPLAFHGHDNLGLAVANSLRAAELGASMIDVSLQGMGRSSGNAATEIVVMALLRMGVDVGIDPIAAMDAGEKYIRPLVRRKGISTLDVVSGFSQFHSSYMGVIRRYASKYRVDPRRLIMEVCRIDRVNAPAELVESVARQLKDTSAEVFTARFEFDEYFGEEQSIAPAGPDNKG